MDIRTYEKIMNQTMSESAANELYRHQYIFGLKYNNDVNYLNAIRNIRDSQINYIMMSYEADNNNFQYEDK